MNTKLIRVFTLILVVLLILAAIPQPIRSQSGFNTGDVILVGPYDIYVIHNGQRRHVPNPETLDALGITRDRINNKGLSQQELEKIPKGPDIPDVNRDRAGFDAFKNEVYPGQPPIKMEQNDGKGPEGYTHCANENGRCNFSGVATVAYGANGSFRYKENVNGGIDCNTGAFDNIDPKYGTPKACYYKLNGSSNPPPANLRVPPPGYTYCADEGQRCNFSGTKSVAYGANGEFRYQNATNGIDCNTGAFGNVDPINGTGKSCYTKDIATGGNNNPPLQQPNSGLPADCSGVLRPHLVLGQQATVTQAGDEHNLRAGNGLGHEVRGILKTGDVVVVISGPRCTDGYQWWQVQTQNQGTWWAAEANGSVYWLQPGGSDNNQPQQPPQQGNGSSDPGNPHPAACTKTSNTQIFVGARVQTQTQTDLRRVPHDPDNVVKSMPPGEMATVIGGPYKCVKDTIWWKLRTDDGKEGWAIEKRTNGTIGLAPVSPASQQPTATAIPQQSAEQIYCAVAHAPEPGIVYAAEPGIGDGECVTYVKWYFKTNYGVDLTRWGSNSQNCAHGNAKNWVVTAASCGWPIDQKAQVGAIVVWQDNCPVNQRGGKTGAPGHVAVVIKVLATDRIEVNEQNWTGPSGPDHLVHTNTPYRVYDCMSFIHVPGTPGAIAGNQQSGQQGGSSQSIQYPAVSEHRVSWLTANKVCIKCGDGSWIEFTLAPGQYIAGTQDALHIAYQSVNTSITFDSYIGTPTGNGGIVARFVLSQNTADELLQLYGISQIQISEVWYITHIKRL